MGRAHISPRYPLVELATAALYLLLYAVSIPGRDGSAMVVDAFGRHKC